jgi:hypothetical protein
VEARAVKAREGGIEAGTRDKKTNACRAVYIYIDEEEK